MDLKLFTSRLITQICVVLYLVFFLIGCNNDANESNQIQSKKLSVSVLPDEYIGRYISNDNEGYIDVIKVQNIIRFNYLNTVVPEKAKGTIEIAKYDAKWDRYIINTLRQDSTENQSPTFTYLLPGDDGYQTFFGYDAFPQITGNKKVHYLKLAYKIENTGILKLYIKQGDY